MKYSIGTNLIHSEFNGKSYCALCQIKSIIDERVTEQFLEEAVMEDHVRARVNKLGFCEKHFDKLYEGRSKLGLALQCHTRLKTFTDAIQPTTNEKKAKKQAENIRKLSSTCIICETVNEHMDRYYQTIAKMFLAEEDFRNVFTNEESICLNHFSNLLENCSYAGKYSEQFLKSLYDIEIKSNSILSDEIRAFCDRFDYRNAQKPLGEEKNALPKTRIKMYGKK